MEEGKDSTTGNNEENGLNYNLLGGRAIANALPGEEIVISGKMEIHINILRAYYDTTCSCKM